MIRRYFLILLVALLASGCATKGPFVYEHPSCDPEKSLGTKVAAVAPVADHREGEKEIDEIYEKDPLRDIQRIIQEELMSTGLFESVMLLETKDQSHEADILLEPCLKKFQWEVPDYEDKTTNASVASVLTVMIGGAIYLSTKTDVYGDASLQVVVVEKGTGDVLLNKTYNGHCEKRMAKFRCDTSETKAAMTGESLKEALGQLKIDLKEALEPEVFDSEVAEPEVSEGEALEAEIFDNEASGPDSVGPGPSLEEVSVNP